jgi:hypothetical protein
MVATDSEPMCYRGKNLKRVVAALRRATAVAGAKLYTAAKVRECRKWWI